jgi:hypothetical protein
MRRDAGNRSHVHAFWSEAAASLPPEVRKRHAGAFETAERIEPVIDLVITSWRHSLRALAAVAWIGARKLRRAARSLDDAARRRNVAR